MTGGELGWQGHAVFVDEVDGWRQLLDNPYRWS